MVDAPYSCHVLDINGVALFWMDLSFRSDMSEIAFLISLTRRILFGERSEFLNKYHEKFHVLFVAKSAASFEISFLSSLRLHTKILVILSLFHLTLPNSSLHHLNSVQGRPILRNMGAPSGLFFLCKQLIMI